MYKVNKAFKAKINFLKVGFSLFLFIQIGLFKSQTWESNISPDFEFSIQDKWGESGTYTAKFVLSNAKTAFVKTIEINGDNIGKLVFPYDFEQTRGRFNKDIITEFKWYIEVKKQKVASGNISYNSSPNTILQMSKYDFDEFREEKLVWGNILDGYQWDDKNGKNIFIRSVLKDIKTNDVHLYSYHFINENEENILVRKLTDFVKGCDLDLFASHNIESIELTDVNKDTIGEISFSYTVDCSCVEDSLPRSTKLMFITNGEKYAIRGLISPKKTGLDCEHTLGENLVKKDLYRRFLLKKWKRLTGEQETVYN